VTENFPAYDKAFVGEMPSSATKICRKIKKYANM
jgi:hypothetical protein